MFFLLVSTLTNKNHYAAIALETAIECAIVICAYVLGGG